MKFFTEFINNIRKHNIKKIDFFFVCVFFVLLFIPMLHVTGAKKSVQENRVLAKQPHFIVNHKLNQKYGMEFNDYFNDRFLGRNILINIFNRVSYPLYNVYQNNKALYIKKKGWMFQKSIPGATSNDDNVLMVDNLKKFNKFCETHNIKLYVLIVPVKVNIYSDILEKYYKFDEKKRLEHNKIIEKLRTVLPKGHLIYPYEELMNAIDKDYLYFKQSHHCTDFGSYILYDTLSDSIRKDFKGFKKVSLEKDYNSFTDNRIRDEWSREFKNGYITQLLNLEYKKDLILTTFYNYYDNKNSDKMIEKKDKYIKNFENKNANLKLFLTGDSFNENLLQFLPYSVKKLKFIRLNNSYKSTEEQFKFMKYYKQELLDFKPDIVVITMGSGSVFQLLKDFYKD